MPKTNKRSLRLRLNKINWESLDYKEMVKELDVLSGPRPRLPNDIPRLEWTDQATRVLKERYFAKDKDGNVVEDVCGMCWRVAWELARAELKYGKNLSDVNSQAKKYYQMMATREFLPNSPTLMNAGKGNGLQYSACYVLPVEDSLTGIFDGIKYQAIVHQSGGGTGFSFSRLRPAGSRVKSTMGVASGPVSFMRVYNEATQQIKQGGMRRGANMGILRVDHPDIMEFIHCKEDGGITNFNISVAVTDIFMKALAEDGEYELIAPHNKEVVGKLSAKKVWNEIAQGAWKTGDPGLVFIDRMNQGSGNPIRADGWEIESTNPCGEQQLYPFDACNLGSIFLTYFVKGTDVDWEKLKITVHTAVRLLDSVIEVNPFPLPQIAQTVKKIRRIGLGVGGWADMLVQLGIPYDSQEALDLAEKIMKFINTEGHRASEELAKERGAFPMWKDSIYAKGKKIRNSTVTTIAPTGSIGILANASGGIEPKFAIAYQHIVKSEGRTLDFIDELFEKDAKKRDIWSQDLKEQVSKVGTIHEIEGIPSDMKRVWVTAHEIDPSWHVKMQAAFQKYTDNAVSKTVNLSNSSTVNDIKKAYIEAWDTGCNGITVFRDGSKNEQVLNIGVKKDDKPIQTQSIENTEPVKERPIKVTGATYRLHTPVGTAFVTINQDEKGDPLELFINVGKAGSDVAAMAEALGRTISTSLRFRGSLTPRERAIEIAHQLAGIGGRRSVGFGSNRVLSLPDAIATALSMHFVFKTNGNGVHKQEGAYTNGHRVETSVGEAGHAVVAASAPLGANDLRFTSELSDPAVASAFPTAAPSASGETMSAPSETMSAPGETASHPDLCPSCGEASLIFEEGCKKCYSCGHSEC